jgi:alkanesulfonate monooxygenase SsuD/methylene tetrahydromethanopterin reductase-like flavin-dependent oxidoreductase (luciferase family)
MDVVNQLFDSWDPDAVVMDYGSRTYADHTKVRTIDFVGKYYKCRGPLNTAPSPQGRPAYIQAGGSPRGRDFAARHADSIIAGAQGNRAKKAFRDDIRSRAAKFGRNPDDIKVLFLFSAVMGETEEEAQAKFRRYATDESFIHRKLALVSGFSSIDLSKFPLDKALPEDLTTNGETASFMRFAQLGSGKPLSQLVQEDVVDIVGTPEQCADHMATVMEEVGGDGFLIRDQMQHINRRTILEVTEGLVPALQRRGLVRTEYTGNTLRETLREF